MTDESSGIELEEFELVEAGPGTALLRVAARTSLQRSPPTLRLVVDDGREPHQLNPLPSPADPPGLLRVAFSAPASLVAGARFALEFTDGSTFGLPAPHRTRRIAPRVTSSGPARPTGTPQAPGQDAHQATIDKLERRLRAEEKRRTELEFEARELRLQHASEAQELDELDRQLTALRTQFDEQSAEAAAQRAELDALRATAAEMAAQLDEAEARIAGLADVVRRQTAERDAVAEQLAAATAAGVNAEEEAARALHELEDQLTMRSRQFESERDEALDRVADLTEVNARLQAELASRDATGEEAKRQLGVTEAQRHQAEVTTEQLRAELAAAQAVAPELFERLSISEAARSQAETVLLELQQHHAQLTAHAEELETRLQEMATETATAHSARLDALSLTEAGESRERELLQRIDELSAARTGDDADLRRLSADFDTTRAELDAEAQARTAAEAAAEAVVLERDAAYAERKHLEEALAEASELAAERVNTARLQALELIAAERARTYALADIAAAGSALSLGTTPKDGKLSIDAIAGMILVALGILVAALILTGVIRA